MIERSLISAVLATLIGIVLTVTVLADNQICGSAFERGSYVVALKECRPLAERGDSKAQFLLGSLYDDGKGVPRDHNEAVRWFRKSAEQGNTDAQVELGIHYNLGRGLPADPSEAVTWFRKAANKGHSGGQFFLGGMYMFGTGVRKDQHKAIELYRKAAAQAYDPAHFMLGVSYQFGWGVVQSDVAAYTHLIVAEALGSKEASVAKDQLLSDMRPSDIATAQRLAAECAEKDYKGCEF